MRDTQCQLVEERSMNFELVEEKNIFQFRDNDWKSGYVRGIDKDFDNEAPIVETKQNFSRLRNAGA
jgi:hypothetical protein